MRGRDAFAYVVSIDGPQITLNLEDTHRGHYASHRDGVSAVTEVSGLFAVDGGGRLLVMRVRSLSFAEPREAHLAGIGSTSMTREPLRHVVATVMGTITRNKESLTFIPDSLVSPALGAEAYPLSREEVECILQASSDEPELTLGTESRGGSALQVGLSTLLGRHVAVLGGTGQGKSCFTAAIMQQILQLPSPRVVVFDINGEYADALEPYARDDGKYVYTKLGGPSPTLRIPYYALGRHGLARLLLPSEKTQRPALTFAIENLRYVKWIEAEQGVAVTGDSKAVLFHDCRPTDATDAWNALERLRQRQVALGDRWPQMEALACLVAESHSVKKGRNAQERDAFLYSNVVPLITRIHRFIDDPLFTSVVDVNGGDAISRGKPDLEAEGRALVDQIFGSRESTWKLHIVDLRDVAHDLMPLVLGSLLELLAFELFRRGQQGSYPTLLVLEEAHHYLRQVAEPDQTGANSLAYERLAKEGRKFGLGLWLSTQRPSEVSPTVLAQCGTWAVFRLTSEQDLRAVDAAGEWVDKRELSRIAGLPRQQALVFGSSVAVPVRITAPKASPTPNSHDPDFGCWTE